MGTTVCRQPKFDALSALGHDYLWNKVVLGNAPVSIFWLETEKKASLTLSIIMPIIILD
jgi:hypothetical protein